MVKPLLPFPKVKNVDLGPLSIPVPVPPGMKEIINGGKEVDEGEIEQMLNHLRDAKSSVDKARRSTSCGFCEQKINEADRTITEALEVLEKSARVYEELKQVKSGGKDLDEVSEDVKRIIRQQG